MNRGEVNKASALLVVIDLYRASSSVETCQSSRSAPSS